MATAYEHGSNFLFREIATILQFLVHMFSEIVNMTKSYNLVIRQSGH